MTWRPAPNGRRRCGAWLSPIGAEQVASAGLRLSGVRIDRGCVLWLEARPAEGGRGVVMRRRLGAGGGPEALTPPGRNVRCRVHEYGGGDFEARDGSVLAVDGEDGALHRTTPDGWRRLPGCVPGSRYGDPARAPDGRWVVAVEERAREGGEPENRLVALPLAAESRPRVVADGHDFVSSPVFSPDGRRLAWLAWDHPDMPWDGTLLYVAGWGSDGTRGTPSVIAGGRGESIFQPRFARDGRLVFVSDRSGWWNLHAERGHRTQAICPRAAEFGRPQWTLGASSWDFVADDLALCALTEAGRDRLALVQLSSGRLDELPLPLTAIDDLRVGEGFACFVGAGPERPPAVHLLRLADGRLSTVRASQQAPDPALVSHPETLTFASACGRQAHAFFYHPRHPQRAPTPGERPPLVVRCHGGPTAHVRPAFELATQYWTSRGFAWADVNYAGSSGFGRAHREALNGYWGVRDVEDVLAAVRFLVREAGVDPARVAVRGGSAGGFTALRALAVSESVRAGAIYYGIADLAALARETHKFEAHYLDRLIGPWPERSDLYRERSPLSAPERLARPMILFQGLDDRVVPPEQTQALAAALRARGVPHACLLFPGEGHGFRAAETIRRALEAELSFYGHVFGFETDVREPVRLEP